MPPSPQLNGPLTEEKGSFKKLCAWNGATGVTAIAEGGAKAEGGRSN